jgi:hypothetical protein
MSPGRNETFWDAATFCRLEREMEVGAKADGEVF